MTKNDAYLVNPLLTVDQMIGIRCKGGCQRVSGAERYATDCK